MYLKVGVHFCTPYFCPLDVQLTSVNIRVRVKVRSWLGLGVG